VARRAPSPPTPRRPPPAPRKPPRRAAPRPGVPYGPRWPPSEPPRPAPAVRAAKLSRLEAVLFGADEPLTARRLAAVAELADAAEARRLIHRLQALYAEDGAAVQVEELAGG